MGLIPGNSIGTLNLIYISLIANTQLPVIVLFDHDFFGNEKRSFVPEQIGKSFLFVKEKIKDNAVGINFRMVGPNGCPKIGFAI